MKQLSLILTILVFMSSCSSDSENEQTTCELQVKAFYKISPNSSSKIYGIKYFIFPGEYTYKKVTESYTTDMVFGINEYIASVRSNGVAETTDGQSISCLYSGEYQGTSESFAEMPIDKGNYYIMLIPYTYYMESSWWACNNKYSEIYLDISTNYYAIVKTFWGDESYRGLQEWELPETWDSSL